MFDLPPVTLWVHRGCVESDEARRLVERARCPLTLFEPLVTPPSADQLRHLVGQLGQPPRALVRPSQPRAEELGIPRLVAEGADDALIDLLCQHPDLIERPIAVSERGAVLCRPPALVLRLCMPPSPSTSASNAMIRGMLQGKDIGR